MPSRPQPALEHHQKQRIFSLEGTANSLGRPALGLFFYQRQHYHHQKQHIFSLEATANKKASRRGQHSGNNICTINLSLHPPRCLGAFPGPEGRMPNYASGSMGTSQPRRPPPLCSTIKNNTCLSWAWTKSSENSMIRGNNICTISLLLPPQHACGNA